MVSAALNDLLVRVARRAENAPAETLRDAFVPVPPLLAQLESSEHQVLFGRRGTGKTHLLRHIQDQQSAAGDLALYVDLRKVGAAGDVFSTGQDGFAELATGLLIDVVEHMHGQVYEQVLKDQWSPRLEAIGVAMDALGAAATQIRVVGETEVEQHRESSSRTTRSGSMELTAGHDPRVSWKADSVRERAKRAVDRRLDRGRETPHVLLGPLSGAFRSLALAVHPRQVWLLLDEWSALPLELQPLLADMLRRTVFATSGLVVKISAIHGRSRFADMESAGTLAGTFLGLELGSDTAATLDLDDFLLFRNDVASTLDFYSSLLHRHLTAMSARADVHTRKLLAGVRSPAQLTALLFATPAAFHNLVLGAEGVPRDFLQIAGLAAGMAHERRIGYIHVNGAIHSFFLRDKDTHIPKTARHVFRTFMEQAVRGRSRIIPLRRDGESNDDIVQRLYDARVIHRVRHGLSLDPQHPTEMYDVYVIDSGAFLGLVGSGKIRPAEDGLDSVARFADAGEIEIRGRTFVSLPPRWYRRRV